jgi:hypothetical protein
MLPNYLVIGAAKCGTTSLCHALGLHPDIFMTDPKEVHFFGRTDPVRTLEWYHSVLQPAAGRKAVGEGSTSYTHPDIIDVCAEHIARVVPRCRLIYIVRDPIDRLESDWRMRRHDGWAPATINEAVARQPNLVRHGLYWRNLSVYRRCFTDEQILVLFLEDFARDPQAQLRRCFSHLGVDPDVTIEGTHRPRNAARDYRKDGRVARRLRAATSFSTLKARMPPWLVRLAKAGLTTKISYALDWDPGLKASVASEFADDSPRFLRYCGKHPDFWQVQP